MEYLLIIFDQLTGKKKPLVQFSIVKIHGTDLLYQVQFIGYGISVHIQNLSGSLQISVTGKVLIQNLP